jgi:hypothetical protein
MTDSIATGVLDSRNFIPILQTIGGPQKAALCMQPLLRPFIITPQGRRYLMMEEEPVCCKDSITRPDNNV